MCFEIGERDLLARIGQFKTKSGTIETPTLLPVINPAVQPVSPSAMREKFNCKGLITNAYILKRHFQNEAVRKGVHRLLGFDGVVMTDSGAYQILVYGNVKVSNKEIIRYQEQIGTDIATILDVPTGWKASEPYARSTVEETLKRAEELAKTKSRDDIAWVGPVQGGTQLNLIAESARRMGRLPFEIHALGSPTRVMEQYMFDTLIDMIMAAKTNLPPERPLHLFGAGHPFMFSLAISLGCDLFDSAAYAIYAREDRYMTESGTVRLRELKYFPCDCPICTQTSPEEVKTMTTMERQELLAMHNLYISFSEIRKTKQAIMEGRLWELLEARAHGHPALLRALRSLGKYSKYIEENSPTSKKSGLLFFGSTGLARPEVARHSRLLERYLPPEDAEVLVLLPQVSTKPFHKAKEYAEILRQVQLRLGEKRRFVHICVYSAPFGVVPLELDQVYPLSQYEAATPLDDETLEHVAGEVANYIARENYEKVIVVEETETWKRKITSRCQRICKEKNVPLTRLVTERFTHEFCARKLLAAIQAAVGGEP